MPATCPQCGRSDQMAVHCKDNPHCHWQTCLRCNLVVDPVTGRWRNR